MNCRRAVIPILHYPIDLMKSLDNICLNCDYSLYDELYCPSCGQKARIKNLSLRYLLSTFYVAFVDFDKKLLRSLRDIWIPNKISENFLSGGRQTYVNHIRFFVVCLASCLALMALHLKRTDFSTIEDIQKEGIKAKIQKEFIEFRTEKTIDSCEADALDSLSMVLFGHISTSPKDSLSSKQAQNSPATSNSETITRLDTIGNINSSVNFTIDRPVKSEDDDYNDGEFVLNDRVYNLYDAYNLPVDSIFTKYGIDKPWQQHLTKQGIRTIKNASSAIGFFISNMLWGILLVTILMAFTLKLLYIRHKSYIVEHVMHMINFHCVLLIGLSILLIFSFLIEVPFRYFMIVFILSGIYLCVSLKKYYTQSWFKTLIKGFVISQAYMMALTVVLFLILSVSFAFF